MTEESILADKEAGRVYYFLRKPPKTLTMKPPMVDYYPEITEDDVDKGYVTRYFIRQSNHRTGEIIEIDSGTYRKFKTNPLYKTIELEWKITGKLDDVFGPMDKNSPTRLITGVLTANRLAVEEADKDMPGLKNKLLNYAQFWQETGEA